MKKFILIFITTLFTSFCFGQSENSNSKNKSEEKYPLDSSLFPFKFISRTEAEKILGHPAHVKDSLLKLTGSYLRSQFHYVTNLKDSAAGQKGMLFFGFEQFQQTSEAERAYAEIKTENEKTSVVNKLVEMGDEGFLVRDQLNFPFIMIRKNNRIFKLKTYNIKSEDSFNELQLIAKKIVSAY